MSTAVPQPPDATPAHHVAVAEMPAGLRTALDNYERSLAADDLAALADAFVDSPATLRGSEPGLLVGPDEINGFRSDRGGVPGRTLSHVEARRVSDHVWLVMGVSVFDDGGRGLQTQLWVREPDRWRICAAHVTQRPKAFDRTVWRTLGDPLIPATSDGPLTGLTVAVKDVFAVAGHSTGAGNPAWLGTAAAQTRHAWAVASLLAGGVSVRGIATTDELAYSIAGVNAHYGTPPNVRDPRALPGGSSSGPASAVALGQADIGLATDTAGSIRVPASYQGLWGLRTSHGLVPRDGVLPLAPTFDTVGWLTRDGETLERVLSWTLRCLSDGPVCGWENGTPAAATRLLLPVAAPDAVGPQARERFERWARQAAERLGLTLTRVQEGDLTAYRDAFRTVQAAEAWRAHGAFFTAHPDAFGADVAERFRAAAEVTAAEEAAARAAVTRARAEVRALLGPDLLALPTVPGPAPERDGDLAALETVRAATLRMTTLAGIGGLPALSVPAFDLGDGRRSRTVGACLVGPYGADLRLVRTARRLMTPDAGQGRAPA
ncbi:AtzH-like domain-containing protein [Streptomyces tendae]|uniref:AtzH-like domain-containing protein n=1 Tax=Streptomyces tendae TaxID=1932 RepID=UPI0036A2B5E7